MFRLFSRAGISGVEVSEMLTYHASIHAIQFKIDNPLIYLKEATIILNEKLKKLTSISFTSIEKNEERKLIEFTLDYTSRQIVFAMGENKNSYVKDIGAEFGDCWQFDKITTLCFEIHALMRTSRDFVDSSSAKILMNDFFSGFQKTLELYKAQVCFKDYKNYEGMGKDFDQFATNLVAVFESQKAKLQLALPIQHSMTLCSDIFL